MGPRSEPRDGHPNAPAGRNIRTVRRRQGLLSHRGGTARHRRARDQPLGLRRVVALVDVAPMLLALSPTASASPGHAEAVLPAGVLSLGPFRWWLSQKVIGLTVMIHVYDWTADLAVAAALVALALWGLASRRLTL